MYAHLNPFAMVNEAAADKEKVKLHRNAALHHASVESDHAAMHETLNKLADSYSKKGHTKAANQFRDMAREHNRLSDHHGHQAERHEEQLEKLGSHL